MKLSKILESILNELNVPKPGDAYKFYKIEKKGLGYGTMYTYVYENVNGDLMEISNMVTKDPKDPGKSIYIAFKKYDPNEPDEEEYDNDEEQEKKYSEKTGANDFIKVLATVVQAVRNTMNKEGGDKNIYSILFSPADKKRKNIYNHYIDTLFPDFKKDLRSSSSSFTKFINKNFKKKVVAEVGDTSNIETYTTKTVKRSQDFDEEIHNIKFTATESKTNYLIIIDKIDRNEDNQWRMDIEFGVIGDTGYDSKSVVNKGELYKVLATVIKATKEELEDSKERGQNIVKIRIEPSKNFEEDSRRANIYQAYIEKNMPEGSKVLVSPNFKQIEILLPKSN